MVRNVNEIILVRKFKQISFLFTRQPEFTIIKAETKVNSFQLPYKFFKKITNKKNYHPS